MSNDFEVHHSFDKKSQLFTNPIFRLSIKQNRSKASDSDRKPILSNKTRTPESLRLRFQIKISKKFQKNQPKQMICTKDSLAAGGEIIT